MPWYQDWQIRCTTVPTWELEKRLVEDGTPTLCPSNPVHAIDPTLVTKQGEPYFEPEAGDESTGRTTTSGGWQTKATHVIPAEEGTYRFHWTAKFDSQGVGRMRIRDITNGSNLRDISDLKPTDSGDDDRENSGSILIDQTGTEREVGVQFRSKDGNLVGLREVYTWSERVETR